MVTHHRQSLFRRIFCMEILSRLPAKYLFKYISWNALTDDPYFIKLHTSRAPATVMLTAIYHPLTFLPPSIFSISDGYMALSSTNGLLCVKIASSSYGICNPVTNKFLHLPTPPCEGDRMRMKLYFLPCTQKYKVVAESNSGGELSPAWYILDIGEGCSTWRMVQVPPCPNGDKSVVQDRHWLLDHGVHYFRKSENSDASKILFGIFSLDIENEEAITHSRAGFLIMNRNRSSIRITGWDGCFAMVLFWHGLKEMIVWVLEDYKTDKWTKKVVPSPFEWDENARIHFVRDGKMWYGNRCPESVFSLDLKTRKVKNYHLKDCRLIHVFPHVSTLEQLDGILQ